MKITFSEPVVVAMGPDSRTAGWGVYQFPDLWRLTDGRLLYTFSNSADSAEAYGAELGCCVSSDNGKTWTRTTEKEVAHLKGIRLRNGDVVRFEEPPSVPLEGISLPEPLCTSRKGFSAYPIESVPEDVCNHSWLIHRINEAHPQGIFEPVKSHDPTVAADNAPSENSPAAAAKVLIFNIFIIMPIRYSTIFTIQFAVDSLAWLSITFTSKLQVPGSATAAKALMNDPILNT